MQTKDLTAVFLIFAMVAGFATESNATGCTTAECTSDGGGSDGGGDPDPKPKGNNGWGNGSDMVDGVVGSGTNAGSGSGGTRDSKEIDGQGVDKFDGKFEGR